MILPAFEKLAQRLNVEPLEVRMKHRHVTWMICRDRDNSLVVIDGYTNVYICKDFTWPEDTDSIRLQHNYIDCDEIEDEIYANGRMLSGKDIRQFFKMSSSQ